MSSLADFTRNIKLLVAAFRSDLLPGSKKGIDEANLRLQYLDPFFTSLGSDVGNRLLKPFYSREVVIEPPHRMQGHNRRPDYIFRIGGIDKLVCEAKRPGEDLNSHYFQVQNYIYNLRLWVGVLCDFEHFEVFLVGSQPVKTRPFSPIDGWKLHYSQYEAEAKKIWDTFSRDSVANGSIELLAQNTAKVYRPGRQGWLIKPEKSSRIDAKFLEFLETKRSLLAKNLHRDNRSLSGPELTEATQKIINRLLFQRICEDRNIDVGRRLSNINDEWISKGKIRGHLWTAIVGNFRYMSNTFNGGLFGKPSDKNHFVDDLKVSDFWLSDFLDDLAGDDSRYLLSVIPVEILGSVYERFLGSIVTSLGDIELKIDLRKSQGVYYTPKPIVDAIVSLTVEKSLGGKNLKQMAAFKIVDPACGSGSFLLAAFESLCKLHLEYLIANEDSRKRSLCYNSESGDLRLTTGYKRTILKNSIFGVDLDSQAIEVTQMSLYLKVLEDESTESLNADHRLFPRETYLPSLDGNIKHGNSLFDLATIIAQESDLPKDVRQSAFDWNAEFPNVMQGGKFDVVIGNPPYFSIEKTWGKGDPRIAYLKQKYPHVYEDRSDVLFYFIARAAEISNNAICFIVSRAFLEAKKAKNLRGWLAKNCPPDLIIDFGNCRIFEGIGIATAIIAINKKSKDTESKFYRFRRKELDARPISTQMGDDKLFDTLPMLKARYSPNPWLFGGVSDQPLIQKIDQGKALADSVFTVGQGMQTGLNKAFGSLSAKDIDDWGLPAGASFVRARNSDIQKWEIRNSGEILLYPNYFSKLSDLPPALRKHINSFAGGLKKRAAFIREDCEWWQYTWPLHAKLNSNGPRIYCPYLATENRFALDNTRTYLGLTDTTVLYPRDNKEDILYFLGLLNSKVLTWRFRFLGKLKGGGIREYFFNTVSKIPIHRIDVLSEIECVRHDKIKGNVARIIKLHSELAQAKRPASILQAIDKAESDMNEDIRILYGLTEPEYAKICEDLDFEADLRRGLGDDQDDQDVEIEID